MKSKANFKSHPLHPILVAFPIAFFTGTLIFDIIAVLTGDSSFQQTAFYLNIAGIAGALLAAIPGFIDYLFTVPPQSSAKKRATKHALINIAVLLIFTVALFMRRNPDMSSMYILATELVGMILLTIAGWLGGTLVYRNQIGVDIRHARAGKWKEEHFGDKKGKIEVAKTGDLETGQMKLLHIGNKRMVLGKTEKGYVAFDDHCTHRGGSLASGVLICDTVQCPWHGSQFDVHTGEVQSGPAQKSIHTYTVQESNGSVFIEL